MRGLAARLVGGSVALIYADPNEFKAVNDRFGHVVGDAALVELARRLTSTAESGELVAG